MQPKATRFRTRLPVELENALWPKGPAQTAVDAQGLPPLFDPIMPPRPARDIPPHPASTEVDPVDEPPRESRGEATPAAPPPLDAQAEADIEAIRHEGLTGRQLRLARRTAERYQMSFHSDLDAVRLLRLHGINPFERPSALDALLQPIPDAMTEMAPEGPPPPSGATAAGTPAQAAPAPGTPAQPAASAIAGAGAQSLARITPTTLATTPGANGPQLRLGGGTPSQRAELNLATEVERIQREIGRRRRRKLALLWARLSVFVLLPTLIAWWYFAHVATPMYSTRSEFIIQQSQGASAGPSGGLGGLFSGTGLATSQDSITVQGYLQSREAMLRLDETHGFRQTFASLEVDPLQRLEDAGSIESAYDIYRQYLKISYDPTEGLIKLEVSAPDPKLSAEWSQQLITFAEEQVNQLSERLRRDQMDGARESYEEAEKRLLEAQEKLVALQESNRVLTSEIEIGLITGQITGLEGQLTTDQLALAQMQANPTPNRARMEPLERRIATLQKQITELRAKLTEDNTGNRSLAKIQSELLVAETDVQTRTLMLGQAAQQLETARIEANRQQRYLSISVTPVAPDTASYPRVFENTIVSLLIFLGIYMIIALTATILREQLST